MKASAVVLSTLMVGAIAPGDAAAQNYPTIPIRMLIGFPAGSSSDIVYLKSEADKYGKIVHAIGINID